MLAIRQVARSIAAGGLLEGASELLVVSGYSTPMT